jgi:type IV pilus assembly protein PilQ
MGMDMTGPLVREIIPMRFTTAAETGAAITPFLSQRGKLTSITHTNSIVIVDTDDNLRQLKNLVAQIDIQTPQISISCKIIQTSTDAVKNVGVNWGFIDNKNNFTVGQIGMNTNTPSANLPSAGGSLPAMSGGVTYGLLSPEKFGVALDYLFRDTKTEIVAQPQITTLNNKEANISIGEQRAITSATAEGTGITQMVSVATQLTVTPYVAGEGKIRLTLSASKEDFGPLVDGNVSMLQKNAKTDVLVNNGETVVIAGLTSNNKTNTSTGIPFLKDIPILGYLFKRSDKSDVKTDLVIFVTPHIIHSEIGLPR